MINRDHNQKIKPKIVKIKINIVKHDIFEGQHEVSKQF